MCGQTNAPAAVRDFETSGENEFLRGQYDKSQDQGGR